MSADPVDPWTPRIIPTTPARSAPSDEVPEQDTPPAGADWTPRDDNTLDLERALLGCLLLGTPDTTRTALDHGIDNTTWLVARHELAWRHIARLATDGITPDPLLIADALHGTGDARAYSGRPEEYLAGCIALAPSHWSVAHYADKVTQQAARRARLDLPRRLADLADDPHRYDQTLQGWLTDRQLEQRTTTPPVPTLADLLDSDDPEYDWLVPGMLERRDRVILTAAEGAGKTTWMRQTGVQLAAGIHPFTGEPCDPVRVTVVDVENSARQNRREYAPLYRRALRTAQVLDDEPGFRDRFHIAHLPTLDLTQPDDVATLDSILTATRPDVLIIGPIYKLAGGDPNDEREAKPVVLTLDRLRADHDCALLLEAHSKKAEGHDPRKRAKEPFGWSGWLRWPEFGIHLSEDGDITHWRGQRDADRRWPARYERGTNGWPWAVDTDPHATLMARMRAVCEDLGRVPAQREMAERLGVDQATVSRHQRLDGMVWAAFKGRIERGDDQA